MTEISGPLTLVTEDAAVVTAVWVQARELRPHGEGAILPQRARATLTAGSEVSFSCAPGPAVLIWQAGGVEDQVPILVDDVASQSLAEVVRAAQLASGRTQDELAALVREVTSGVAAVTAAASSTQWDGDRLTVMGVQSPPLTGPQGPQGPQGPPGAAGDGTGDVLWSHLNPVLAGKAAASHKHVSADIANAAYGWTDTPTYGNRLVKLDSTGRLTVPTTPSHGDQPTSKSYVDGQAATRASATDLATASARIDSRKGVIHSGTGGPPSSIPGAVVGDWWLNENDMSLYKITGL